MWTLSPFLGDCKTCGLYMFRSMRVLIVSDKWWVIIIFNQMYCLTFINMEKIFGAFEHLSPPGK